MDDQKQPKPVGPRPIRGVEIALLLALMMALCVAALWWPYVASQPRMTEEEVLAAAKPVMREAFGEYLDAYEPYRARFRRGVWHVWGTLPEAPDGHIMIGGTPQARVRDSSGEVLDIGHGQ